MRKKDRERNGMDFPKLHYPELYLLDGGYKTFYEKYPVSQSCLVLYRHSLSTICVGSNVNETETKKYFSRSKNRFG